MSAISKTCVIIGAGPGNGTGLAKKFTAEGYKVALIARDAVRLADMEKTIAGTRAFPCDIANIAELEATFERIQQTMGSIDVLIHNAGKGVWGDVLTVSLDDFETTWRLNSYCALAAVKKLLPTMIERQSGTIIFIGATASRRGAASTAAFAPAKAAQRSLAESLAKAYGPKGVHTCLIIIDAVVDEPFIRGKMKDKPDEFFCKPDEIAETAFMLAQQKKSAWTFELDVRPFGEKW